ncbi:MAG: HEAT repeat domain-containing protein [Pirellulaceae bacterium]|jgi:hypothetical protein|nr:HEAT repeat domain-containing protein [Pirellulaceae bacterium]MDP6722841.1 HEAT repeat domain-containing protein [Pirellulaceae bacterium]
MTEPNIVQILTDLETGALLSSEERSVSGSLDWLAAATRDEIASLLAELATRDFVSGDKPRDAGLASICHQLALRVRRQSSPGDADRIPATELAAMKAVYDRLPSDYRSRAYLLQILATARDPDSLRALAEWFVSAPLTGSEDTAIALGPLMQFKDYDPAALFPRLLDAIAQPVTAAAVMDLSNFVTRQQLVDAHPAAERGTMLIGLLGQLAQQLGVIEELRDQPAESSEMLAQRVEDGVALAVALCDALALIGNKEAVGKLYQAMELSHRRLRTEAAAALARLGEEAGEQALLELVTEPVARLRVLAYAEELDLLDKIEPDQRNAAARAESELALWLAQPAQLGIPPTSLEIIDDRNQYWPGYDEPVDCFLLRFHYQFGDAEYANIAIVGPVTHAFAANLDDIPHSDIYAAFAGWQAQHEDIFEVDLADWDEGLVYEAERLERLLHDAGYDAIQMIRLGFFLGEKALVARATKSGQACIAVADVHDVFSYRAESGPRAIGANEAYAIYKGRKLLRSFNP